MLGHGGFLLVRAPLGRNSSRGENQVNTASAASASWGRRTTADRSQLRAVFLHDVVGRGRSPRSSGEDHAKNRSPLRAAEVLVVTLWPAPRFAARPRSGSLLRVDVVEKDGHVAVGAPTVRGEASPNGEPPWSHTSTDGATEAELRSGCAADRAAERSHHLPHRALFRAGDVAMAVGDVRSGAAGWAMTADGGDRRAMFLCQPVRCPARLPRTDGRGLSAIESRAAPRSATS